MSRSELPAHLRKYVVEQNYERYTPIDQAVWRYILRQLVNYLSEHAHESYLEGLQKTGISIEEIPHIEKMSQKLEEFGWKALPVSGFIPPAAFMEFQSLGYLPIASDMRTIEHTMYTPAPDIVHEAAGHAPIISEPEYAAYLKDYAQVARKSILSHEDILLYEAIRDLSDIKEAPDSTDEKIQEAEKNLELAIKKMTFVSEASQLGRMNWWTAEYGLIGDINDPKIFGAGLLSSPGESQDCLSNSVKKLPLSVDCVNFSYDITEPQPQLFVAKDFQHLKDVLQEFAQTMSFTRGGIYGLEKAVQAQTVNTIELSSGIQISGPLGGFKVDSENSPIYLQFNGPTQLSYKDQQLLGHSVDYHSAGYGTAVGPLKKSLSQKLENMSQEDLKKKGIEVGRTCRLEFQSEVLVDGHLKDLVFKEGKLILMTFDQCKVTYKDEVLFDPSWGIYDLSIGESIPSVFGGAADREAYGETVDFIAKVIPLKEHTEEQKKLHQIYQDIRDLRQNPSATGISSLIERLNGFPNEWLARLEIYEILLEKKSDSSLQETYSTISKVLWIPKKTFKFILKMA